MSEQNFDIDNQEMLYLQLRKAHESAKNRLKALFQQHQISETQYNTLRILAGASPEGLTMQKIISRLVVPDPDLTRLVDRLEKQGWAQRSQDPKDRRLRWIHITPKGIQFLKTLYPILIQEIQNVFSNLSKEDKTHLSQILTKLI